jgi:hypothetical protein
VKREFFVKLQVVLPPLVQLAADIMRDETEVLADGEQFGKGLAISLCEGAARRGRPFRAVGLRTQRV